MDAALPPHLKGLTGKKLVDGLKQAIKDHESRYGKGPKWAKLHILLDEALHPKCRNLPFDSETRCRRRLSKNR